MSQLPSSTVLCALFAVAVVLTFPQATKASEEATPPQGERRTTGQSTALEESSTDLSTGKPQSAVRGSTGAAKAAPPTPFGFAMRRKAEDAARRASILNRIRREGEEASLCFVPDDGLGLPPSGDVVTEEAVGALLREVLDGLGAHDGAQIRDALVERKEEQAEEAAFFGAADHLLHPSTDLYKDPLKALTNRPNLHLDQIDPHDFDYPVVVNARVQDWMVYFLTRGRTYFTKWLARSERYMPLIIPMLEEAGLPRDLVYQSMIESGFNPYATSRAQAVGVWQFISSTGKAFGLRRDWWVDERRDPVRATRSAIAYMTVLKNRFGDWELASAAYNAGEGKIARAIKRYGTRNFWELSASSRTYLKPETKNYVPKIIAAAILGKYAERYGLLEGVRDEDRLSPWEHDIVAVDEATDLSLVARLVGEDLEVLESINPALRRGYTPPGTNNYPLNVPLGRGKVLRRKLAKIPERERRTFVRYAVRRGDTLGRIASRYGVPLAVIQRMNHIRDPKRLRVGRGLLIPVRADSLPSRSLVHVVVQGETLSGVAKRYGMTVDGLKDANKLKDEGLQVGQKLRVRTASSGVSSSPLATQRVVEARSEDARSDRPVWHSVQNGDSLTRIASRYGTSVADLRRLNGIGSNGLIHPGDRLRLRSDPRPRAPDTLSYRVATGDTVSAIGARFGMSSDEVLKLNGLNNDRIRVGQVLQVQANGRGGSPLEYTVVSGDSLFAIAARHQVSVESLQRWNRLDSSTIRAGEKLLVYPRGSGGGATPSERAIAYQVQSGDTLWAISQKYGVSVKDLKGWNDLRGDRVRPGQRLRVILR